MAAERDPRDELPRALEARPRWVRAVWATPGRRLFLSACFLALAAWIFVAASSDPTGFLERPRAVAAFCAAPLLTIAFGIQAIEAASDIIRGQNSLPVFHRIGWWLDRRGLPVFLAYLLVMAALVRWLSD